jgi:hypothetical protein
MIFENSFSFTKEAAPGAILGEAETISNRTSIHMKLL